MIPDGARPRLYLLAPFISLFCAIGAFGLMPFGGLATVPGTDIQFHLYMADSNVALLFVAALGLARLLRPADRRLGVGLQVLAARRHARHRAAGVLRGGVHARRDRRRDPRRLAVVHRRSSQEQEHWVWYIVPQFLGFLVFMVAAVAESNRPPFDLTEADGEVVAGYHTEYGGMRFAMFANAEFINAITLSALASVLFLAGPNGPGCPGRSGCC